MDEKERKAASIHQRLLNKARETSRPFMEVLQYYAMEKFLLRMSQSVYSEHFILKGALLLRTTGISEVRPTRDIDFMGDGTEDIKELEEMIANCCNVPVEEDGLIFNPESVVGEEIREQDAYKGVRLRVRGTLGSSRIHIQIDIGFGDAIVPGPLWIEYPVLLEGEAPKVKAYTLESAIAEKFQAMVALDLANSRMKDFYDIYFLIRNRSFEGIQIQKAIEATFKRRKTALPAEIPTALTDAFYSDAEKVRQWGAFRRNIDKHQTLEDFGSVITILERFLWPVVKSCLGSRDYEKHWEPSNGWG